MKKIRWNSEKSTVLQADEARGRVGFEECLVALEGGKLLAVLQNPSINHPSQKMFVLNINGYAYCVPFVESKDEIFLKTVFPSRRFTAIYITEIDDENPET